MSPEQLFPRPGHDFGALLAALPRHLDAAMPMRKQHRRDLPGDIRQLSHLLTDERGDLRRDYLADPAALSAYLRYFLPWNIHRLGTLFNGLALDPGGESPDGAATIIDLGTGPLTAPLTLWMSRPHLRKRPLTFVCVDRAPKPMRLGLAALESMAAEHGDGLAPWRVKLVKAPLDAHLREKADLLIMANALNEVLHRGEGELLEDAGALAWHLRGMLAPGGAICVVEPGIRPSAHLLAALRRGLLHEGLHPVAPCPHEGPCPMSGRGYTAWCHFNFEADAAPRWLRDLSEAARLSKDNVSLSFLHFSTRGRKLEPAAGQVHARAVSGPFALPAMDDGARRYGQYACTEHGLTLLVMPQKHLLPVPGALIEAPWPEAPATDAKSGALVLPLGSLEAGRETPAPLAGRPASPEEEDAAAPRKDGDAPRRKSFPAHRDAAKPAGHGSKRSATPGDRHGATRPGRPDAGTDSRRSENRHAEGAVDKRRNKAPGDRDSAGRYGAPSGDTKPSSRRSEDRRDEGTRDKRRNKASGDRDSAGRPAQSGAAPRKGGKDQRAATPRADRARPQDAARRKDGTPQPAGHALSIDYLLDDGREIATAGLRPKGMEPEDIGPVDGSPSGANGRETPDERPAKRPARGDKKPRSSGKSGAVRSKGKKRKK